MESYFPRRMTMTASAMITVSTWGGRGSGKVVAGEDLRVRISADRSGLDAAVAQIERRTRLHVVSVSPQGTSLRDGEPDTHHYELTLGTPVARRYGGGCSVEGSLWIAVPVGSGMGTIGYRG